MKQECTELFLHYREVARLVWNLGFRHNPKLREWDCVDLYREAMARLFEGMILLALGYQGRMENKDSPGEIADFHVTAKNPEVQLWVDKNRPEDPGHLWGHPVVHLSSERQFHRLKFVRFFDWDLLGSRDFRFLEVLIGRLDERPDLVGHHALVEVADCLIWLVHNENPDAGPIQMETVSKT